MADYDVHAREFRSVDKGTDEAAAIKAARAKADPRAPVPADCIIYRDGHPWRLIRAGDANSLVELTTQGWLDQGIDPVVDIRKG